MSKGPCDSRMEARIIQERQDDEPFMVVDLEDIEYKYNTWMQNLERVKPFYAVKCNDDVTILRLLAKMSVGFDCASKTEIETILNLGVSPSSIIFAHPCKSVTHLRYAKSARVDLMTFDNERELDKIKQEYPNARLVIRIKVDDSASFIKLGKKFGCEVDDVPYLLQKAKQENLNVVGLSFHCGSECVGTTAVPSAIELCRKVFDIAEKNDCHLEILDIGGGYPGRFRERQHFHDIATAVKESLDKHFPEQSGVRIMSEPGRYFVSSAFTLYTNVVGIRVVKSDDGTEMTYMYFINDGIYGCFHFILFHNLSYTPIPVKDFSGEDLFPSSVWGPTCDSKDLIVEQCMLPKLKVGDWIKFQDMGDYTLATASSFNGFRTKNIVYVDQQNNICPEVAEKLDAKQHCLIDEKLTHQTI